MGLDVWYPNDVRRILASARMMAMGAMAAAPQRDDLSDSYMRGVEDTLRAVGAAFGIDDPNQGQGQRYLPGS